jgi:ABC-type bacteriocin/lantibiotic exporter with double-glycine peptidase domain
VPEGEYLQGEIVLDRVTFGYDTERLVLEVLSLRISAGRTTAIVGFLTRSEAASPS